VCAILVLSQSAFADTLDEGKSIRVTGINAFAGKSLELKLNGLSVDGGALVSNLELLDAGKTVMVSPKVPGGLDLRGYFIDASTGLPYFREKISISSLYYPETPTGWPSKYGVINYDISANDYNAGIFDFELRESKSVRIPALGISVSLEKVSTGKADSNAPPGPGSFPVFIASIKVESLSGGTIKTFSLESGKKAGAFGNTILARQVVPIGDSNGWAYLEAYAGEPIASEAVQPQGNGKGQSDIEAIGIAIVALLVIVIVLLTFAIVRKPAAGAKEHKHEEKGHHEGHEHTEHGHEHKHEEHGNHGNEGHEHPEHAHSHEGKSHEHESEKHKH